MTTESAPTTAMRIPDTSVPGNLMPSSKKTGNMSLVKVVLAATIGSAFEWYNLTIYGFLSIPISHVFFPVHNETTSLLIALGTFGVSYLMRPVGALYLGSYADKHGRRAGMVLTMSLMGFGALMIALAPSYAVAGPLAPMLVVFAKLLEGFSAGGEFGSSVGFLVEHAPKNRRGLVTSFQIVGVGLTSALSSFCALALNHVFTEAEIVGGAWRLPFIFGLLILPIGWFTRRSVDETPSFLASEPAEESPVRILIKKSKLKIGSAVCFYCLAASTNYLLGFYIATYAIRELGIPARAAFWSTLSFSIIQIGITPIVGWISDRIDKTRLIETGIVLILITTVPAFHILNNFRNNGVLIACVVSLGIFVTIFQGAIPAFLSELFPVRIRTSGLSIIHNINFVIFGGFAPFLMTSLIASMSDRLVPAYYVLFTAILSICGLRCLRSVRRHQPEQ